ncbi:MAG: glycoside hydrolase family 3 C-terminal domain-containing protein, partial [Candidatus Thermoplasmatota archaeon]|nr:glycoside hydrolase family 3 C-terminal domain-containing protein [Candidatus Thermoplasmatota archaeon]
APVEARVEDLLSRMTLEQKCNQMRGFFENPNMDSYMYDTKEDTELGIPGFMFVDGPRGVRRGNATAFPVGMARGSTWNEDLEYLVGIVMGNETKAKGTDCLLAPCMNLVKDPHGGRTAETYGEDTWQVGRMAVAFVEGVQSEGAMACAKHYAANSDENQRHIKNSVVDLRTLNEIYLPHFKMVATEADVASFMTCYNRVNGQYGCENQYLVREKLKGEWGFDGFVVSDWVATTPAAVGVFPLVSGNLPQIPVIDLLNFTDLPYNPTTQSCLVAGLDVEMPFPAVYQSSEITPLVESGIVPESLIDDAVRRILRMKFEYGMMDNPRTVNEQFVLTPEHISLARAVEQEAIVMLKNHDILPLDVSGIKSIAVIGPAADDKGRLGDHGSSNAQPGDDKIITTLAGIKNKVGSGVTVKYDNGSDPAAAAELARTCDAAVVVVGRDYTEESEGKDLSTLALSDPQPALINAVGAANKNTVVVLITASVVTMNEWIANAPAILMAWYPGMEGGNAIADIIFGDANPSGKLTITFPKNEADLPPSDSNELDMVYSYYHGYRYFDKNNLEPLFPFGYGLSYTTFEYSNMKVDKSVIGLDGKVKVSVDVKNTGDVAGAEVVQLYIGYEGSAVDRSVKDLKGFDKVFLQPGEKKTVTIEVAAENVSYYSTGLGKFVVEPITYDVYVGASSRDIRETGSFRISENQAEIDGGSQSGAKTPGFELFALFAAIGAAALLMGKRRK